jgi:hypothetical protein
MVPLLMFTSFSSNSKAGACCASATFTSFFSVVDNGLDAEKTNGAGSVQRKTEARASKRVRFMIFSIPFAVLRGERRENSTQRFTKAPQSQREEIDQILQRRCRRSWDCSAC